MSKSRNWCVTRQLDAREHAFMEGAARAGEAPCLDELWFVPKSDAIKSLVFQFERCPKTARIHMQAFVQFTSNRGMPFVKKTIGNEPHCEIMRGSVADASAYCRKPETRLFGPYLIGQEPSGGQGKRTDLEALREMVKERKPALDIIEADAKFARYEKQINFMRFAYMEGLSDRQATGVDVKVFYGATGTGKTFTAVNYCGKKDYYIAECPSQKNSKLWFNGYEGQKTLILDDFSGDYCTLDFLKRLLDCYKLKVEFKGGFVWACWTTVIITTNYMPDTWYTNALAPVNVDPLKRRIDHIYEFLPDRLYVELDWAGKHIGDVLTTKCFELPLLPPGESQCTPVDDLDDVQIVDVHPPPQKRQKTDSTVAATQPWPDMDDMPSQDPDPDNEMLAATGVKPPEKVLWDRYHK